MSEAYKKRDEEWMNELHSLAGLKPDWAPLDEKKSSADQDEDHDHDHG